MSAPLTWQLRDRILTPGAPPLILGIVNVTPDSFSDGGRFLDTDAAVTHALHLVEEGADLLDIGGESTRPGSQPVALEDELSRVLPVVRRLAVQTAVPLSVDTNKAEVARQALEAGAHIINDITALQGDPAMPAVIRAHRAGVILMHMQGTPATMQTAPHYANVVAEVAAFLEARLQACADLGIAGSQVVLDPGIGFGKTAEHNVQLLAHLEELRRLGRPVCLGVSRKGFLGQLLGRPLEQRLAGSLAAVCFALARGSAQIFRVHDVAATRDAVGVMDALRQCV
ncbi:MAG TPA: dihydropteroate synthase [Gemmataceae bacterium]|nr:dihydropteroate synthase [Gemmataceae bacterium]